MFDIGVKLTCEHYFFGNSEEFGRTGILGQPPRTLSGPMTVQPGATITGKRHDQILNILPSSNFNLPNIYT